MTAVAPAPSLPGIDAVHAIVPYLGAPEDVIRCAAARALAVLGDASTAPALVEALMDPDPDLRADAMAALVRCARPEDAPAIRRSLESDPVAEVKVAAIQALARLKDEPSIPLLRGLVLSRCEPAIAWEERESAWDDWLDVQVAAIDALGAMGAANAVDDLIRARDDEDGQDLDHVVFGALAQIPGRGVEVLRGFLGHGGARVRQRALAALSKAACGLLLPMREALVHDSSPQVRRLAIGCFGEGDDTLAILALEDPDASVRAAALARTVPARPDVVRSALRDPDEAVRAVVLEACASQPARADEPDLAANAEAWLRTAGARLATTCAAVLPTLAGAGALNTLRKTADDETRQPEVRIAALRSLGTIETGEAVDSLRLAAANRSSQVRLAALAALAQLVRTASGEVRRKAILVVTDAVRGALLVTPEGKAPQAEASAETADDSRPADAEDTETVELSYPRSTLEAIQTRGLRTVPSPPAAAPKEEQAGSPARRGRARPRRVAIEGSGDADDIAMDIRLTALRQVADCTGEAIDTALADAAGSDSPELRTAALDAIARRAAAMPLSAVLAVTLKEALDDREPPVRAVAARALAAQDDAARHLAPRLQDPLDTVRAAAVSAVAAAHPEGVGGGFRDPSPLVRRAAIDGTAAHADAALLENGLRMVVEGGWADSLAEAGRRHPQAHRLLLVLLREDETLTRQGVLMILEALSRAS